IVKKNQSYDSFVDANKIYLKVEGRYFQFEEVKSYAGLNGEAAQSGVIKSKMPGKILETCVSMDQKVQKGELLIIMESMKMENSILSPLDGVVSSLLVTKDDLVEADQLLIEITQE
ncbi:acetyl-CoA carboxylase biotin carboxyl carrier protein subunit, partial [bacterium]|nr:acetyl-CoA carboxylase biotin carboxyl carrier protein subunit [bacterium]